MDGLAGGEMALKMEAGREAVVEVLGDRKMGLITVLEDEFGLKRKGGCGSVSGVSKGVPMEEDAREVGGYMLGDKMSEGGVTRCRLTGFFAFNLAAASEEVTDSGASAGKSGRDRSELRRVVILGRGIGRGLSIGLSCCDEFRGTPFSSETDSLCKFVFTPSGKITSLYYQLL